MRKLVLSRALAVLAAMCLMTGMLMMFASAASAQTPSSSPPSSPSPTPSASSSSPSGSGLPAPLSGLVPGSSASPSPSATDTAPATNPGGNTDVLGQTIPKTGADRALPLLIAGVILAATSVAVRRVVTRRG